MKNLSCEIILDNSSRELNNQGTTEFPVAIYNDYLKLSPVPYHWHEEIELIIVVEGEMEVIIEFDKFIIKSGQGIFINSGRLHSCTNFNNSNCIIKSFVFHSKFIYGKENSLFYQKYFYSLLHETSEHMKMLPSESCKNISLAYNMFLEEGFAFEFRLREILTNILIPIIETNNSSKIATNNKRLKQLNRCKKMILFIHNNYNKEISLIDIASCASVKESEALRCFKICLNTSPIKYLKKYRLEQAAILLKTTINPIIDISLNCGFFEISYFSKSFKEMFGCTPTEYRKNILIIAEK